MKLFCVQNLFYVHSNWFFKIFLTFIYLLLICCEFFHLWTNKAFIVLFYQFYSVLISLFTDGQAHLFLWEEVVLWLLLLTFFIFIYIFFYFFFCFTFWFKWWLKQAKVLPIQDFIGQNTLMLIRKHLFNHTLSFSSLNFHQLTIAHHFCSYYLTLARWDTSCEWLDLWRYCVSTWQFLPHWLWEWRFALPL